MITGMNHAVLYVRDARRHQRFYTDVLGFHTVIDDPAGRFVFMRGGASTNHHDIAFFTIGDQAGPSAAGAGTVGLYHVAWEVASLAQLDEMRTALSSTPARSSVRRITARTRASTPAIPTGSSSK